MFDYSVCPNQFLRDKGESNGFGEDCSDNRDPNCDKCFFNFLHVVAVGRELAGDQDRDKRDPHACPGTESRNICFHYYPPLSEERQKKSMEAFSQAVKFVEGDE